MGYNGYKNYETWNVCLWIGNDEGLHELAASCADYSDFKQNMREIYGDKMIGYETPDSVPWSDSSIDLVEMDQFWQDNFPKGHLSR